MTIKYCQIRKLIYETFQYKGLINYRWIYLFLAKQDHIPVYDLSAANKTFGSVKGILTSDNAEIPIAAGNMA